MSKKHKVVEGVDGHNCISQVTKLDGIRSWSLEAGVTCPWSYDAQGTVVPACAGCYAKSGNYCFGNVKRPRQNNRLAWRKANWVDTMVATLEKDRYFRWFDSGDIYHPELALKIREVVQRTPWVKHWIPTRSHKSWKIKIVMDLLKAAPNVVVRYSSDSILGEYSKLHGSTIVPKEDLFKDPNVHVCNAYVNAGKCDGCRACWDKDVAVIGYPAHGMKMLSLVKNAKPVLKVTEIKAVA